MDNERERIVVRIDPDLMEIIPDLFDFRRKDISTITSLVAEGNFPAIKVIGHNLKGAGGGFGFDAISEIGQRIEHAAEKSSPAEVSACVAELAEYLGRVEVRYS
ncbi:MAG TPA: Hpt domain-containing protein [Geobacteraceae bacterium]